MNYYLKQAIYTINKRRSDAETTAWHNKLNALSHDDIKDVYYKYQNAKLMLAKTNDLKFAKDRKEYETKLIKLLKSHNINLSDLKPKYVCNKCKDTGYINNTMCSCLRSVYTTALLSSANITKQDLPSFATTSFDIVDPISQENTKKIYQLLSDYIDKFATKNKNVIILSGPVGVGKTHLLLCVLNKCIDTGLSAFFSTTFNFNNDFVKYNFALSEEKSDIMSKYLDCDVLLLDDLGAERIEKNTTVPRLYQILNERELRGKSTIISTNLTPDEIMDVYGERIFSRLFNAHSAIALGFSGSDLRLKKQK